MTERKSAPTWMYRAAVDGTIEPKLFDHPDDVPSGDGWADSPRAAVDLVMPKEPVKPAE